MGRLQSLQALRFFAALAVVQPHATVVVRRMGLGTGWVVDHPLVGVGSVGVDIFFVLSGAIMMYVAAGQSPGDYLWRRAVRVAPPYYVATMISALVMVPLHDQRPAIQEVLTSILFWPAWENQLRTPVLGIGWTLCFEMLFYAAVAIVLWRRWMLWPLLMLFGLAWWARIETGLAAFQFLGNPMILEFLAGACIMKWGRRVSAPAWAAWLIIGLAVFLIVAPGWPLLLYRFVETWNGRNALLRVIVLGIPAAMIVWGALQLERHAKGPLTQRLAQLGDASYALYLIHLPLFWLVILATPKIDPALIILGLTAMSVPAAVLFHLYVERPLVEMLRKPWWRRLRTVVA